MRMHASSTYIGLLNAINYVAFFFLPLGKIIVRHVPIMRLYSIAWILRSVGMLPALYAPFAFLAGHREFALNLTLLGVLLFHVCRGIGMIANNPVMSHLATGPDRGSYLTQIQIINSAASMFSGFAVAMLLGRDPPLFLYAILMAGGIISGIFTGVLLNKIPEPPAEDHRNQPPFFSMLRESFATPSFKQFIVILLFVVLVSAIARTFLIVYSREVFDQSDGMVLLYTVFGGFGNLMIGLLIKFLVDRIGVKPLYILCTLISFVGLFPVIFFPHSAVGNTTTVVLFLAFLFFVVNFGFLGAEGIAQTYFLGLVPAEKMLDMGIVYYFVFAVAGVGGSFLAGLFLDILAGFHVSAFVSYKILFAILCAIIVRVLFFQRKLVRLGSLPFKMALGVMLSFRDLRAITLLDKLDKTHDTDEEEALLEALHDTPSKLAIGELLEKAKSPRLAVRTESLHALEALETLNDAAEKALMDDLIANPYTTAYISARILGNHGVTAAMPILRELAGSDDYMLAGEAIIALARLKDSQFLPQIESLIINTKNPRLKIMGVEALGIYGSPNSLSILLDMQRVKDPLPYIQDEVTLAMASILDLQNSFYALLVRLADDEGLAATLGQDEAEAACEYYMSLHGGWRGFRKKFALSSSMKQAKLLQAAVAQYMQEKKGKQISTWIQMLPDETCDNIIRSVLAEVVMDDELGQQSRLQLLIAHWSAHQLKSWANKLKQGK
jgi:MFS family permease